VLAAVGAFSKPDKGGWVSGGKPVDEAVVFYSWQRDLPAKTNRTLIEDALEAAGA
jgi:hypothetical protein